MAATVTHARRGRISHSFRYRTDYLLLSLEDAVGPTLFSRSRFNLFTIHDRDHGGARGNGEGARWASAQFAAAGLVLGPGTTLALLTQPRLLGHWFTPVSFWLVLQGDAILAAIAEVNNTFGQRHCYLCRLDGFAPIGPSDTIRAEKVFHVSPFQDVAGEYRFNFAMHPDRLALRIAQIDGENGLDAAMAGPLVPLTNTRIFAAALRRPGGSLRVLALIYWNALRLAVKGARYHKLPLPPENEIT